jgi:hypothetical protein
MELMALHELTVWPVWRLQFFRLTCGCGGSLVCNLLVSLGGIGMSEVLLEQIIGGLRSAAVEPRPQHRS